MLVQKAIDCVQIENFCFVFVRSPSYTQHLELLPFLFRNLDPFYVLILLLKKLKNLILFFIALTHENSGYNCGAVIVLARKQKLILFSCFDS